MVRVVLEVEKQCVVEVGLGERLVHMLSRVYLVEVCKELDDLCAQGAKGPVAIAELVAVGVG